MHPVKAIIFDLDGTLLDTIEDIGAAMNAVLSDFGFPPHEIERYKMFVGDGAGELVSRALPEESRTDEIIRSGVNLFVSYYDEFWRNHTHLYPGISGLLETLCQRDIPLAILSNKPHAFALTMVEELLPDQEFDIVRGLQEEIPKKPDPTGAILIAERLRILPEHFCFVGDSGIDMHTAVSAGMFPCGVSWGFRSKQELLSAGAQKLLNKPDELLSLIALR
ncbi:MAG: HAD family hydrolase [FCB group bacterium]|nr:HAD family hydrolase [FCB group bacterium]